MVHTRFPYFGTSNVKKRFNMHISGSGLMVAFAEINLTTEVAGDCFVLTI